MPSREDCSSVPGTSRPRIRPLHTVYLPVHHPTRRRALLVPNLPYLVKLDPQRSVLVHKPTQRFTEERGATVHQQATACVPWEVAACLMWRD